MGSEYVLCMCWCACLSEILIDDEDTRDKDAIVCKECLKGNHDD